MLTIRQLSDELNAAQALIIPKGKFKFKSRKQKTAAVQEVKISSKLELDLVSNGSSDADTLLISNISGKRYEHNEEGNEAKSTDCLIKQCQQAIIVVRSQKSLSTCHVVDCKDCIILILSPISGSLFVDKCNNVSLVVQCQQLRVHTSSHICFYLHVTSNPIIEDCANDEFAPFKLFQEAYSSVCAGKDSVQIVSGENRYEKCDDFRWIKAQASPNWKLLSNDDSRDWK